METALWRQWEMLTGVRASALWRPPMVKFWKYPVLEIDLKWGSLSDSINGAIGTS